MGRRIVTCPMDLPDYPLKFHRRNTILYDLWGRGCNPLEIGFPTLRSSSFTPSNNNELLEKSLDLVEEQKESVMVQLAYYQHKLKQGYDVNVKLRPLAVGDLVLRKVVGAAKNRHGEN